MKTVTFQTVMNLAAEYAQRTRDKLPAKEQVMLHGFIAADFDTLFNSQPWAFLIPDFAELPVVNSKLVLDEDTYGDILAVTTRNPHQHRGNCGSHLEYSEGNDGADNRVLWLESNLTSVWVEYMQPYPGTAWPALDELTLAAFLAATCPREWTQILARQAAASLLQADSNPSDAGVQLGLAQRDLEAAIVRFCPTPSWRGFRVSARRRAGRLIYR